MNTLPDLQTSKTMNTAVTTKPVPITSNFAIGSSEVVLMAGPCSVESYAQTRAAAEAVARVGGRVLRGGAFKPRTSPDSFQGLGQEGLDEFYEVKHVHWDVEGQVKDYWYPYGKDDA